MKMAIADWLSYPPPLYINIWFGLKLGELPWTDLLPLTPTFRLVSIFCDEFLTIWHFGRNHYFFHKVHNTRRQVVLKFRYAVFMFWRFLWSYLRGLTYLYLFSADKQFDMSTYLNNFDGAIGQAKTLPWFDLIFFTIKRWLIKKL